MSCHYTMTSLLRLQVTVCEQMVNNTVSFVCNKSLLIVCRLDQCPTLLLLSSLSVLAQTAQPSFISAGIQHTSWGGVLSLARRKVFFSSCSINEDSNPSQSYGDMLWCDWLGEWSREVHLLARKDFLTKTTWWPWSSTVSYSCSLFPLQQMCFRPESCLWVCTVHRKIFVASAYEQTRSERSKLAPLTLKMQGRNSTPKQD